MGKPTGFMEYDRCEARSVEPKERIKILMNSTSSFPKKNKESRRRAVWIAVSRSVSRV